MKENAFTGALLAFLRESGIEAPDLSAESFDMTVGDVALRFTVRAATPDTVYCQADVASMEGLEDAEALLDDMLEANFFWEGTAGGTLAIDPETKQLMLEDRREMAYFAEADFADYLNAFVTCVAQWRTYVAEYRDRTGLTAKTEVAQ